MGMVLLTKCKIQCNLFGFWDSLAYPLSEVLVNCTLYYAIAKIYFYPFSIGFKGKGSGFGVRGKAILTPPRANIKTLDRPLFIITLEKIKQVLNKSAVNKFII